MKETLEESELQKNNNNKGSQYLSVLKFQKNKKERIFNKFYFEKDNIKQIKNKDFKNYVLNDFNKSKTLNNFSTAIGNNALFNNTNSNFNNFRENEEDEYNKYDDIDVDEFFYIDSNRRNPCYSQRPSSSLKSNKEEINNLNAKKINSNVSINKSKDKENEYCNDYSLDEGNNSSLKLPNLYQNQPYEEFEFLKKMILDPDFLSQHARNVIKFEK